MKSIMPTKRSSSGTAAELTPIRELDNRTIGEGHAGPVTKALQAAYFKAIKGQDPRYGHWLTNYKFLSTHGEGNLPVPAPPHSATQYRMSHASLRSPLPSADIR